MSAVRQMTKPIQAGEAYRGGLRGPEGGEWTSAESYARHLARYISDVSTIRVRVIDEFGRAPERAWIERRVAERRISPDGEDGEATLAEARDFAVVSLVQKEPEPEPVFIAPPAEFDAATTRNWRELALAVCAAHALPIDVLLSKTRTDKVARIRHLLCALLAQRGNSFAQIGRWLGRDHNSVIHGVRIFETKWAQQPDIAASWERFSLRLAVEEETGE